MLYPKTDGKKTVGGVEIPEEDKDKMILKLKVLSEKETISFLEFAGAVGSPGDIIDPVNIDFGNGEKGDLADYYFGIRKEYDRRRIYIKN